MTNNQFKILLIEDDTITSFIVKNKLKNLGFENVTAVENGLLAIDYLKKEHPKLIFLDINMPIMDGFDFLSYTEKNELCTEVPIIVLSSSDRMEDQAMVKNYHNVIDYIEKPLNYQKIHNTLLKIVEFA